MTLSNLVRGLKRACLLLAIPLLYDSCGNPIWLTPVMQNATFTFTNILGNCHNPLSSSAGLPYTGSVVITYFNTGATQSRDNDPVNFSSGSDPSTPVSVTVKIPKQNFYQITIIVSGKVCSTCTPTQIGTDWTCIQQGQANGVTAGIPRYESQTGIIQAYSPTFAFNSVARWTHLAVPNSCGCLVPY